MHYISDLHSRRQRKSTFYVWKVTRRCNGDTHCLSISWGVKAHGIELKQPAYVGFRAYMKRGMKVGPAYDEVLYGRAIKFSPLAPGMEIGYVVRDAARWEVEPERRRRNFVSGITGSCWRKEGGLDWSLRNAGYCIIPALSPHRV